MYATYSFKVTNGPTQVDMGAVGPAYSELLTFGDGSAVVIYQTADNRLAAHFLDSQGIPVGTDKLLTSALAGQGKSLWSADVLNNGNIVIAYYENHDIKYRVYDSAMNPLKAATTALDGTGTGGYDYYIYPNVSHTSDGGFIVSGSYAYWSGDWDLYYKRYQADGTPPPTGASQSYAPLATLDTNQATATLSNGNIAAVWFRDVGSKTEIWTAIYSPTLGVVKAPSMFIGNISAVSLDLSIAARSDGGFAIAAQVGSGTNYYLYTATLTSGGAKVADFWNYDSTLGPAVASSPGGHSIFTGYGLSSGAYTIRGVLALPDGSIPAVVDFSAISGQETFGSPRWINPYTLEFSYASVVAGSLQHIQAVRGLVVRTTYGDLTADTMIGDALVDVMIGNGGNDTMDGAGGPDTMRGGAGNDTYYVDDAGDVVDEESAGSDGYDTVNAWLSYALPNNVEALVLLGGATTAIGNALNNYLQGNNLDNWLDGSFGADLMKGLGGNDSYVVDNAGDVVNEIDPGSGGWDTVYSSIDYKLDTNVEALVLLGTLKLDGRGNGLANFIVGNIAANGLKGGGGNDTIKGLGGSDKIDGGGGSDTADYSDKTKAVTVTLDGSKVVTVKVGGKAEDTLKNIESLIGGSKGDTFKGDSKANRFDGGLGKDSFTGKDGNDMFVFSTAFGPKNVDTITDFSHKHDKLVLTAAQVGSFLGGTVGKGEFYAKEGATKAHDANDRLIYNKSNGNLYIDVDGKDGAAAVLFAKLSNHASIDHHDFLIV